MLMERPKFYYQDLNNYTSEFLIEIILWHKEKIDNMNKALKQLSGNKIKKDGLI
jgi:hypothetical protein